MKVLPKLNQNFWRRATNFWTIILFIIIIFDFITDNALDKNGLIIIISVFYTASLAIYSAEKEFQRWHDYNQTIHPGELYVVIWTILILSIIILDLYLNKIYELPVELRTTYIVVMGTLALTKQSKYLYRNRKR